MSETHTDYPDELAPLDLEAEARAALGRSRMLDTALGLLATLLTAGGFALGILTYRGLLVALRAAGGVP